MDHPPEKVEDRQPADDSRAGVNEQNHADDEQNPPSDPGDLARLESFIRKGYAPISETEASTPRRPIPLKPPAIAGYEDLVALTAGGQGVVYEAVQTSTKRKVALKLLLEPFPTDEQLSRFEHEIECVARLRHPNIVTVYECRRTEDGKPFYAMEFVDGRPLNQYLAVEKPPLDARLQIFMKIADAVAHAHEHGVVHRDLKPGNILIDPEGEPRVLDFGLARRTVPERTAASSRITQPGAFLGTLAYAAPEQFSGDPERVNELTDVWALGALLYEMLTDEQPFKTTGSPATIEKKIQEESPPKPSSLRRGLNADLDTIVFRALAKEPQRRYASAAALVADVRRFMAGEPIEARRDSVTYVLRKRARRHRAAILVGITFCALALATVYFWRRSVIATFTADRQTAMYLLNEARLEAGSSPESAMKMLDQAIRLDPSLIEAQLQRALILWRIPDIDGAIEAAEQVLKAYPHDPKASAAHILLARFYERPDPQRAQSHRAAAAGRVEKGSYYDALLEEDDKRAIAALTAILSEKGFGDVDALIERIVRFQNIHDYDAMLEDALQLIKQRPKWASAWNAVGTAYDRLGNYPEALRNFDRAVRLEPGMARSYLHRARVYGILGRHREAVTDCDEAIELDPKEGLAYALRAWERNELGESKPALADCEQAIKLSPWNPLPYCVRGIIAWNDNDKETALQDLHLSIKKDPKFYGAYLTRAGIEYECREYAKAVQDATSVIELPSTSDASELAARAYDLRARAYENLQQFDLALDDLSRVIEANPRSYHAYYNRGRCRRLSGDYETALADHDAAVRLSRGLADAYYGRALVRRFLGDDDGALEDLEEAISRAPKPQQALLHVRIWEIRALRGENEEADRALDAARIAARNLQETNPWTRLIVAYLAGDSAPANLLSEVDSPARECDARYYIGIRNLVSGNRDDARAAFEACVATKYLDLDEYSLANWHLKRMADGNSS